MMNTVTETTARIEHQDQLRRMSREMDRRIKNTLAVISAIINQTLHIHSGDEARQILHRRIDRGAVAAGGLGRS